MSFGKRVFNRWLFAIFNRLIREVKSITKNLSDSVFMFPKPRLSPTPPDFAALSLNPDI